jgi:hypothetical protein
MTRRLTLKSRLKESAGTPLLASVTRRQLALRGRVDSGGRGPPLLSLYGLAGYDAQAAGGLSGQKGVPLIFLILDKINFYTKDEV